MNRREKLKQIFGTLPTPVRKVIVLVFGGTVLIIGVAMIFLPGPAMLIIPLGLTILSLEFIWARVLLKKTKAMAHNAALKAG
ncbi:MAG: PGPGW domain-containing protein, partial [bacterium]